MVAKPLCPLYKNIIKPLDRVRYPELRYIISSVNFTFSDLLYYKQAGSSQKGIVIPDDKTTKIEFYRFIPKYFFKLNPIPNNPRSM